MEIIESNESKIICKIKNANPGMYQIELYQDGKVFILDNKINFIAMEYSEPTKDNIYFLPDTIYIDENNKAIQFTLYGTDFEKYKIEAVYLNNKNCYITKYKDSLKVSYEYTLIGIHEISFLFSGKKITLEKKLIVILKDFPLNLNSINKCSINCGNLPGLMTHKSQTLLGGQTTLYSFDSVRIENKLNNDTIFNLVGASYQFPYSFSKGNITPYSGIGFKLTIDFQLKLIKYLEYYSYSEYHSFESDNVFNYKYKFENLPYIIVEHNGNPQLLVDVSGKDIDNYYPLCKIYNFSRNGNNTKFIEENSTITRIDSNTGKLVNYYPATDSSYIKITIGN